LRETGFTLVELMIAVALSVVLLGGVIQIFAGTKATYRQQDNLARLQENARFAIDSIARDLRLSGYRGCTANGLFMNTLNNSAALQYNFAKGLEGQDNVASPAPTYLASAGLAPNAGTDVIIMRRAEPSLAPLRLQSATDAANVYTEVNSVVAKGCPGDIDEVNGLCPGDVLMIADCTKTTFFQSGTISVSGAAPNQLATITHPSAGTPGNSVTTWGSATSPNTLFTSGGNTEVFKVNTVAYWVQTNPSGTPALYKLSNGVVSELVEGVQDMQIKYGIDNNADKIADVYVSSIVTPSDWDKVVSAEVHLLLRTLDNNVSSSAQQYTFNGTTYSNPPDKYIRREFSSTITLRNRAT